MAPLADVLNGLVQTTNVSVRSNSELVGEVESAAAKDDRRREEKLGKAGPLRRKPKLSPILEGADGLQLTPWDILHTLARALTLTRRGSARGLAEHWGSLKYSHALTDEGKGLRGHMRLSAEARGIAAASYKRIQSEELGTGFGLALAEHILRRRKPDHMVSIVHADTALRAGWALTSGDKGSSSGYQHRPLYFVEAWKPGEPSLVLPVDCRGNHGNAARSHQQLAAGTARVESVHIGPWNLTPCLMFSTELNAKRPLTVHAVQAPGTGGRLGPPSENLDQRVEQRNNIPFIHPPTADDEPAESLPGFHIRPKDTEWFQRVLAHTAAAEAAAFSGDGKAASRYLTERQGSRYFSAFVHAATGSVQDVDWEFLGTKFVGTEHIFRSNRDRVEVFSGVAESFFNLVGQGEVEQYRREVYARRSEWPDRVWWDEKWGGPVSLRRDGSVLAIRPLALCSSDCRDS